MASSTAQPGPTPAGGGGVLLPIPETERQAYLDNSIWYTLALWPALTVAVQNSFGGPDSSDKRDWFAGVLSERFADVPDTDHDDLVAILLQVMEDEFDVRVEDESEEIIAGELMALRKKVWGEGDRAMYEALVTRWKGRGKKKVEIQVQEGGVQEGEWSDVEEEDEDEEMADAPPLVSSAPKEKKEKPAPEIDDEGFEKVVSKKKR